MKTESYFPADRRWLARILTVAAVVGATLQGVPAYAQLSRVGTDSKPVFTTFVRGTDVAYDPQHGVYLVCGGQGALVGVFISTTGDFLSSFPISNTNSNNPYGQFPTCRYSAAVNNGNGGFLIAWHQGDPGNQINLHSILAAYPTGAISSDTILSDTAEPTWFGKEAAIAFSSTSNRFLVVWASLGRALRGRLVAPTGAPIGSVVPIASAGSGGSSDPDVAWNPQTNEFGIAYTAWSDSSHQAWCAFRRVTGADASPTGNVSSFGFTGGTYFANVEVNNSNHYVLAWSYGGGSTHVEFDAAGNIIGDPALMSTRIGTPTSLSIAFNPVSGTVLAAGEDLQSLQVAGLELDGSGAPLPSGNMALTNGAASGSFYAKSNTRTDAREWAISYSRDFTKITDQIISTATNGGGPPTGGIQMVIDTPGPSSTITPPFGVGGWAVDTRSNNDNGIGTIHVWAIPTAGANGGAAVFVGSLSTDVDRPDVEQIFGNMHKKSGFGVTMSNLPPGQYLLVFYPFSSVTGQFDYAKVLTRVVNVNGSALTQITTPTWGQTFGSGGVGMNVTGYAVDLNAQSGTGIDAVHVWAVDANTGATTFLGGATTGLFNAQSAAFGVNFQNGGFSLTNNVAMTPGLKYILVFSHSAGAQAFNIARLVGVFVQ